jgi:hypothetical protein
VALGDSYPLIGINGARSGLDVDRFVLSGAHAVELASVLLIRGREALRAIIDELTASLDGKQADSLDQIIGATVGQAADYADLTPLDPTAPTLARPSLSETRSNSVATVTARQESS